MPPQPPTRAWPRWPTLILLTTAVLGAHLALLADGLPSWSVHTPQTSAPSLPTVPAVLTRTIASDPAPASPATVQTGQVRWIAPPVARPVNMAQPTEPAAKVTSWPKPPTPRPAPTPTVPTSEPATVAAVPMPEPPPAEIARSPDVAADPTATPTDIRDAPPEPASDAPPAADNETQLAKAADQHNNSGAVRQEIGKAADPAQPPASAQLTYNVEGNAKGLRYSASGTLDWLNDGGNYSARMEIRMFLLGSRVQTSQGHVVATGLQPERFSDKRRSERAAHFDHIQNRIRFSNNAPDADLLPGAQDRLSVILQLAGLLNARPEAYAAGQSIAIPVAGTSGSEVWRFQVQGLTSLDLPAGSVIARHLVREPREPHDIRVDIWLAPGLGHLPVRIRLTQDSGDVVDQLLSALP